MKLTPRLALGASYNLWRGHWKEDDAAVEIPLEGEGLPVFFNAGQFRWASFQDGANFGAPLVGSLSLPLAVGERTPREWRLKLSLILRITDTDKLRGTLRKVFGGGGS